MQVSFRKVLVQYVTWVASWPSLILAEFCFFLDCQLAKLTSHQISCYMIIGTKFKHNLLMPINMPAYLRVGVVVVEQVKLEKSKVNGYKSL